MELHIAIHNAKKVTFDGRDCFIVSLNNNEGLLFNKEDRRYDPDATSEHDSFDEALGHARGLYKRRGCCGKIIHVLEDGRCIKYEQ